MSVQELTKEFVTLLNSNKSSDLLPLLSKSLYSVVDLHINSSNIRGVLVSSIITSQVASDMAVALLSNPSNGSISTKYRRISRNRLQAICTYNQLDFLWESNSISHKPDWKLYRICLEDPDNEELYWKPWFETLQEAEVEYDDMEDTDTSPSIRTLSNNSSLGSSVFEEEEDIDDHFENLRKLKELTIKLGKLGSNPYETTTTTTTNSKSFQRELLFENYEIRPSTNYHHIEDNGDEDNYWNRYDEEYQLTNNTTANNYWG